MNRDKALVVFSGGQDSTTCLFWAKRHFKEVVALSFIYGQQHVKEVDLAREIAAEAGVEWACLDVSFIAGLGRNSLTDNTMIMDEEKPEHGCPNTFVPGLRATARFCRTGRIQTVTNSKGTGVTMV